MLGDSAPSVLVLTIRWVLINVLEFLCLCFFYLYARKRGIQLVFVFRFCIETEREKLCVCESQRGCGVLMAWRETDTKRKMGSREFGEKVLKSVETN